MDNVTHAFMGGNVEEVKAGEMDGVDRETGQPRHFTWDNKVRVTGKGMKANLTGVGVKALVELYNSNDTFRDWCDRC